MELRDVISTRKSVRKFSNQPVEEEKITTILEAARLAPSWKNSQCWKFILVTDVDVKKELIKATSAYNQTWLGTEPLIIVACGDPAKSGYRNEQYYYLVDVAIAMEHLILAATDLGLGTCWIGAFDEDKAKAVLGVPPQIRIVAMTPLGYPTANQGIIDKTAKTIVRSRTRNPLSEIVCYNHWK